MSAALKRNKDIDGIFFLGDGLSSLETVLEVMPHIPVFAVRGNCDGLGVLKGQIRDTEGLVCLEGVKILYTHGHLYGVKTGLGALLREARIKEANLVLFGHTHIPYDSYSDGIYCFNPGAASGYESSFGIITLENGNILISHGKL